MNGDVTAEEKLARTSRRTKWTLRHKCAKNTHKDQGGIQAFIVFPHRDVVVLVGFPRELVVLELDAGAVESSEEVRKERR